jgi:D-glycero-D-manno-heptose 1,7-bisphosphate phosphatase
MSRRFVLLDRDGTIIVERHYLADPADVRLLPNAGAGLRALSGMGFGCVVVTNQSGLARGYFDAPRLAQIHDRMTDLLAAEGIRLDGIYVCPHLPDADCTCRKPSPGLAWRAVADHHFDLRQAIVIGDKACDIDLGHAVGAASFLVRTGYGLQTEPCTTADVVVDDLAAAAAHISREPSVWRAANAA